MNAAHLHLILTHVPVLGTIIGTGLLLVGTVRKSRTIQRTGLGVLVLSGVAAGAAYLTGEGAEDAIEGVVPAAESYVDRHESAALVGLVIVLLTGGLASIALIAGRKGRPLSRKLVAVDLAFALVASATTTWVANLSGQIGHSEIRSGAAPAVADRERDDDR